MNAQEVKEFTQRQADANQAANEKYLNKPMVAAIEKAYLATKDGSHNPGIVCAFVDVPDLRRVVLNRGEVLVDGELATPEQCDMILAALKAKVGK